MYHGTLISHIYRFVYQSIYQSICLSNTPINLSVYLSVYLSIASMQASLSKSSVSKALYACLDQDNNVISALYEGNNSVSVYMSICLYVYLATASCLCFDGRFH